jgi:hypothetical protein
MRSADLSGFGCSRSNASSSVMCLPIVGWCGEAGSRGEDQPACYCPVPPSCG